jgi:hypothetical protein
MIAGGFGIAWALWGASGLTGGPAAAVRVGGFVIGVLILLAGALLQRPAHRAWRAGSGAARRGGSGSLFVSPGYRLEYTVAWFACVVGAHFVAFGRLFWVGFYWLGVALLAAGVAGAVVGLTGGDPGAIRAVSALIAAASLFAAGGWTVLAARAGLRG